MSEAQPTADLTTAVEQTPDLTECEDVTDRLAPFFEPGEEYLIFSKGDGVVRVVVEHIVDADESVTFRNVETGDTYLWFDNARRVGHYHDDAGLYPTGEPETNVSVRDQPVEGVYLPPEDDDAEDDGESELVETDRETIIRMGNRFEEVEVPNAPEFEIVGIEENDHGVTLLTLEFVESDEETHNSPVHPDMIHAGVYRWELKQTRDTGECPECGDRYMTVSDADRDGFSLAECDYCGHEYHVGHTPEGTVLRQNEGPCVRRGSQ